jgi:hypothetical protein
LYNSCIAKCFVVLQNVLFHKTFCFTILQFHETFISLVSGKTDRESNETFYKTAALFACFAFRETEIDQFVKHPYLVACSRSYFPCFVSSFAKCSVFLYFAKCFVKRFVKRFAKRSAKRMRNKRKISKQPLVSLV